MPIDTTFHDPTRLIDHFDGAHSWLSNFDPTPVSIAGVTYPTREHAYHAGKTTDLNARAHIVSAPTPTEAKRLGQRVPLRADWDIHWRYVTMRAVLAAAFTNPALRTRLLGTGDALLIETNQWHDQVFGDCQCVRHRPVPGENHLGRDLMTLRSHLRGERPDRWIRAAVTGHRPEFLTPDQQTFARDELTRIAVKLRDKHDTQVALTGCALGADKMWDAAAHAAGLDVWAYIPFPTQAHRFGPDDTEAWVRMVERANRRFVISETYAVPHYHHRNEYMVRDADVMVVVHDPAKTTGGTASTLLKARAAGKPIIRVDVRSRTTHLEQPTTTTAPPITTAP